MRGFVADAFSAEIFGGNQAGVILLDGAEFPVESLMQAVAGELKHSETAFVRQLSDDTVHIRYFTPTGEVDLCGHATIASFSVLRELGMIRDGAFRLITAAGEQTVRVEDSKVFLTIRPVRILRELTDTETAALLAAYGLGQTDVWPGLPAALVDSGLTDIMLPVRDRDALMAAVQKDGEVSDLSRHYDAVGVHMFCPGDGSCSARCSNFAPLWGIPEECATGTANAGLTAYLTHKGILPGDEELLIVQGEHMGRRSEIRTRLVREDAVEVGGTAVISMELTLRI